jgi:hypothetical protein
MLGRQWQFDELHGEDAGSPILATVVGESAPFSRYVAVGDSVGPLPDAAARDALDLPAPTTSNAPPLEAIVEAEVPAVLPVRLRAQWGAHLVRLLRRAQLSSIADVAIEQFAFPSAAASGQPRWDPIVARLPDGAAIAKACTPFIGADGSLSALPAPLRGAAGARSAKAMKVLQTWLTWVDGQLVSPGGASWDPGHLEYSFKVQSDLSDGPVVFDVAEYTGGTLDWFHGDLTDSPRLGTQTVAPGAQPVTDTSIPTPVAYAGMPSDRLFAFEDSAVYLGGVEAGRTDLARLAVTDFALAYSCDWFQIGIVLPYGSVTRIDRVEVVDTFGHRVQVAPAAERTSPGWTVFQSTPQVDGGRLSRVFVLAPTVTSVQESPPLEEVVLLRDEMANLVWGVEHVVPDAVTGEPVNLTMAAASLDDERAPVIPDAAADSTRVYRLMTSVPGNWIPFVAYREDPAALRPHHVLERRPMLRFPQNGPTQLVHPRGTLLLTTNDADRAVDRLRISEEEVPREGVVVTRAFQLARTVDGGSVLWIGRQVRTGRGEGASGLRFDLAQPRS